jgi:CBS domain-containing protein
MRSKSSYFKTLPPAFANASVEHVMRKGVLSCRPETPIRTIAQTMAANHVHCLIVTGFGEGEPGREGWAVVSDLAVVKAAIDEKDDLTAADVAKRPVIVTAADTVARAAQLMCENHTHHIVVVGADMQPEGILSSLDIAANLAWGLG